MTQLFAWDFAGTGQAAVTDLSGNGRGFTPTGNNTRTAAGSGYTYGGARPNAVGFHQTAADTQIGPAITGLNVTPRTVCGWAIITGSANGWVISMDRVDGGNPSGTGVYGVYNNSGSPQFRCKDNSGSAFTRSFTGNAAYRFYALTYDGTNLKVYQSDGAGTVAQVGANIAMGSVWDATRLLLLQQMGTGATLSDWQAFDTAKTLSELQTLANTPLDAGTTPVSATRATTWRTAASVTGSRATNWDVLSGRTATRSTTWDALVRITATRSTSWVTRAQIAASRTTNWRVLTRATGTRATTWNALSRATSTRATTWRVAARVTASRATNWDTLAGAASTRGTTWAVASTNTTVIATRNTTWAVAGKVTALRVILWDTRTVATSSRACAWDTLARTQASRASSWRTRALAARSAPCSWRTLERASAGRSTFWAVDGEVTPYTPITDPVAVIHINLATATARVNTATAVIRANSAEAT